jgi:hypothetical protein
VTAVGWQIRPGDRVRLEATGRPGRPVVAMRISHTWATVEVVRRATIRVTLDGTTAPRWVHRDHVVCLVHGRGTDS